MTSFQATAACRDVPAGWLGKESITLLHGDGVANVIASSEPLAADVTVDDYAAEQGRLLETEFDGYVQHSFEPSRVFGGRPGFIRDFSWTPPDSGRIRQIQLYSAADGRGYTATATTTEDRFASVESELLQILTALEF